MIGNCAKRVVRCTLETLGGEVIIGENWCLNPQDVCPREDGEEAMRQVAAAPDAVTRARAISRAGANPVKGA